MLLPLVVWCSTPVSAIVVNPNDSQIREALDRGQEAAKAKIPPNKLYWHFGQSGKQKPQGFVMSKLNGLTVLSTHFALRSEHPTEQDIKRILGTSELQVSVTLFGSSPQFALDSYLVLKQGNRLIKPTRVRADARAARSSTWPASPAYRAKIVASFPYDTFDPVSSTTIVVFPGEGGEIVFELDFSTIP